MFVEAAAKPRRPRKLDAGTGWGDFAADVTTGSTKSKQWLEPAQRDLRKRTAALRQPKACAGFRSRPLARSPCVPSARIECPAVRPKGARYRNGTGVARSVSSPPWPLTLAAAF